MRREFLHKFNSKRGLCFICLVVATNDLTNSSSKLLVKDSSGELSNFCVDIENSSLGYYQNTLVPTDKALREKSIVNNNSCTLSGNYNELIDKKQMKEKELLQYKKDRELMFMDFYDNIDEPSTSKVTFKAIVHQEPSTSQSTGKDIKLLIDDRKSRSLQEQKRIIKASAIITDPYFIPPFKKREENITTLNPTTSIDEDVRIEFKNNRVDGSPLSKIYDKLLKEEDELIEKINDSNLENASLMRNNKTANKSEAVGQLSDYRTMVRQTICFLRDRWEQKNRNHLELTNLNNDIEQPGVLIVNNKENCYLMTAVCVMGSIPLCIIVFIVVMINLQ